MLNGPVSENPSARRDPGGKQTATLRDLLVTLFGVIFLFTYGGIGYFVINYIYQAESTVWRGRQQEAASHTAAQISTILQNAYQRLDLIPLMDPAGQAANPGWMQAFLAANPDFVEVAWLDAQGAVIGAASQAGAGLSDPASQGDSAWFQAAQAGQRFVGLWQPGRPAESAILLALPAPGQGAVAARLRLEALDQVVSGIHLGDAGLAWIVDESGQFLGRAPSPAAGSTLPAAGLQGKPYFTAIQAAPNQAWYGFYKNLRGVSVAGATQKVSGTPWIILTEMPASEIFYTTRLAFIIGTLFLLVFMLVIGAFTRVVMEERIFRPMLALQNGVERMAQGDLKYRVELAQDDEIGAVAAAFNAMTDRLSNREQQLQALNSELESRVAERTLALAKTNQELQTAVVEHKHVTDQQIILYEVLRVVSEQHNQDEVARVAVEAIESYTGYPHVCLVMPEPDGRHWVVKAAAGPMSATAGTRRRITEGVIGRVFTTGHTQVVADATQDPDYVLDADGQLYSELATPLRRGERLLGVLNLESDQRSDFSMEDCWFLEYLADAVALAVDNCRLLDEAQRELAERRRVAEQLQVSLREKEVLLQEIHHRVKNNLQVVSSLLSLQARQVQEPRYAELFKESQNRVASMALIHEKLYQTKDLARIDFAEYVRNLVQELFHAYPVERQTIQWKVEAEEGIFLAVDAAIPCGLIVNELVSNALKHAFEGRPGGEICVRLSIDAAQRLCLEVADNGRGLPAGLEVESAATLGLRLVNTLVAQLHGTMEQDSQDGATFRLSLKVA